MNERLTGYLNSLEPALPDDLALLEEEALAAFIPIIRKEEQSFFRTILQVKQPARVLEIGTGTGFSALFFRHYCPEAEITTIEIYPPRIEEAKRHFREAGADTITLLEGDAGKILPELTGPFDLIFLDGPKGQYPVMLPELLRLLDEEGILLADNVLQQGMILESRTVIKQRDRSNYDRIREFLRMLSRDSDLSTSILPIGDGVSFTVRRKGQNNGK